MLGTLSGKTTDRKLRLFAAACCRRVEHLLPDDIGCREAITRAERFADGSSSGPTQTELVVAAAACSAAFAAAAAANAKDAEEAAALAAHAAYSSSCLTGTGYADDEAQVWSVAADASAAAEHFDADELAFQASLLRHIIGNPFRPSPPMSHVPPNVRQLAEAAYQQNRTAIGPLSDALLEAGLAELAGHFAYAQLGHPKGCWVLDLLTGRA
jgi:hypothetical protein